MNTITKKNLHTVFLMYKCINFLKNAALRFTLDVSTGHWQDKVDKTDLDKIAYTSHFRSHNLEEMHFNLENSPEPNQRALIAKLPSVE